MKKALKKKVDEVLEDYQELLVEEYIAGTRIYGSGSCRSQGNKNNCTVYNPLEFVFPEGKKFKTYSLKTSELHEECNIPCKEPELGQKLKRRCLKNI